MTANQISYAKLREETRHNYEVERYNARMAQAAEENAATNRMNANTNWQNVLVSANQVGVNAAAVNVQAYAASEQARHNLVAEEQQSQSLVNQAGNTASGWFGKITDFGIKVAQLIL